MPTFLSETFVLQRGREYVYDLAAVRAIEVGGISITGPIQPNYRRWGFLWLRNTTTLGTVSFDVEIPVGPIWIRQTQFRTPVGQQARRMVFRAAKDVPLGGSVQFFGFYP